MNHELFFHILFGAACLFILGGGALIAWSDHEITQFEHDPYYSHPIDYADFLGYLVSGVILVVLGLIIFGCWWIYS